MPVTEPALQDRLREIIAVMLRDDRRAWWLDRTATGGGSRRVTEDPAGRRYLRDPHGAGRGRAGAARPGRHRDGRRATADGGHAACRTRWSSSTGSRTSPRCRPASTDPGPQALPDVVLGEPSVRRSRTATSTPAGAPSRRHGFGARLRRAGQHGDADRQVAAAMPRSSRADVAGRCAAPAHRAGGPGERPARSRRLAVEPGARAAWTSCAAAAACAPCSPSVSDARVRDVRADDGAAELSLDEVEVLLGRTVVGTFAELEVESTDGRRGAAAAARGGARGERPRGAGRRLQGGARHGSWWSATQAAERERRAAAGAQDPRRHRRRHARPRPAARCSGCTSRGCSRWRPARAPARTSSDLHKMRVATRRMRAMWRVFDGAYRPRVQERYVRELREVVAARWARCATWTC